MPPRLLFLHHTSLREAFGGVEYYMDDLVRFTREVVGKDAVHCVYPLAATTTVPQNECETWVQLSASALARKFQRRFSLKWFHAACQAIETFKPTLLVSTHSRMASFVYLLSRKYRLPYATVAYGIDVWGNQNRWEDFVLRRSHSIFSISEWTKKVLVERGHRAEQIAVIHPGFPQAWETLAVSSRAPSPCLRLLTISRLSASEQYKGQDHLLQALGKIQAKSPELEFEYTIQGDGTDKPRLQALSEELGLQKRVRFFPPVKNRDELSAIYAHADIFAMPSRFGKWDGSWRGEGFGIVYVEAAAHGVPSLAYDCGGATDIILNEKTGWLMPPDHVEKLAEKIEHLARHPHEVRAAGQRARAHVLATFSHQAILDELERALTQTGVSLPRLEKRTTSLSR